MHPKPASYEAPEWQTRQTFVDMLSAACAHLGVTCSWSSDAWIAQLKHGGNTAPIYGYTFPLNNAATGAITRDKAATTTVLQGAGIPVLPHYLLRLRAEQNIAAAIEHGLRLAPLPLVLKPNAGESGGYDVVKCMSRAELTAAMHDLATRHRALAVSPFVEIAHEYRVVVLDNKPKVTYEKLRQPCAWHHNLTLGATPHLVTDATIRKELERLAAKTLAAVQGRLAAVDIIHTPAGWQVMEINGGITFDKFSAHSAEYAAVAQGIYADIVAACFKGLHDPLKSEVATRKRGHDSQYI